MWYQFIVRGLRETPWIQFLEDSAAICLLLMTPKLIEGVYILLDAAQSMYAFLLSLYFLSSTLAIGFTLLMLYRLWARGRSAVASADPDR